MVTAHFVLAGEPVGSIGSAPTYLEQLLAQFDPVSLPEVKRASLLNRTDTKYIMRSSQLYDALRHIARQYRVLEIDNTRLHHYQTLYFDTSDFALYRQHHNGQRARYKVRVREYLDSELAFLEVKRKTNQGRTIKSRLRTADAVAEIDEEVGEFVGAHSPCDPDQLEPKLWNEFFRITLVSKRRVERLTLDLHLEFGRDRHHATLPGIAVAEVKQEHFSQCSDFTRQMRRLRVQPTRFSKYCMGICMLYDDVKTNNFKSRMRLVHKLMQEELAYEYVS